MFIRVAKIVIIIFSSFSWGCQQNEKYGPEKYLLPNEQKQFLSGISRYIAKLPKRATHSQKFDNKYNSYYEEEMKSYQLVHYFISQDSIHFFLVTRPAPSLYDKKVAIGGRLKYNDKGEIAEYEEVFRTWKLKKEELERKGVILFAAMVEKGNVNEYLPDKTKDDWVEFPDNKNYFDKTSRRWRMEGQNDSIFYIR
jgi:hypothetical protein